MNHSTFTYLLQNPTIINGMNARELELVIQEFPYFQSSRVLQLKAFHNSDNYRYNQALKKTAAVTVDREVLFNFITSPTFIQPLKKETVELEDIEIIAAENITLLHKQIADSTISEQNKKKEKSEDIEKSNNGAEQMLEIGKPIHFNKTEPHSFNEWMQLVSGIPIIRKEEIEKNIEEEPDSETKKISKFDLINKFIETNPKINPVDKTLKISDISLESDVENESLMTETLAKVYLEQKKYDNAMKAYHILSLKYPEKSGFFADRIKAIKILQKNKS